MSSSRPSRLRARSRVSREGAIGAKSRFYPFLARLPGELEIIAGGASHRNDTAPHIPVLDLQLGHTRRRHAGKRGAARTDEQTPGPSRLSGRWICPKTKTCTSISLAIISAPTRSQPHEAIAAPGRMPSTFHCGRSLFRLGAVRISLHGLQRWPQALVWPNGNVTRQLQCFWR